MSQVNEQQPARSMRSNAWRERYITRDVPTFEGSPFVRPPELAKATVAIVTTAGLHHSDEPGWGAAAPPTDLPAGPSYWRADESFRVIDRTRRDLRLAHYSQNFDRSGFAADLNVVFPIDRLEEMAAEGIIGGVAEKHVSFVGVQDTTMSTIRVDSGPAAAKALKDGGADVVLITPMCPVCSRTVAMLSLVFEAHGLATVGISVSRSLTERVRPPRALFCEFPLGRPLGRPRDAPFQRRVLDAAFDMLAAPSGPVLIDFPETIDDESTEMLACQIPPRDDADLPPSLAEALALLPAYRRRLAATGWTSVGRAIPAERIGEAISGLLSVRDGAPHDDAELPGVLSDLALDVRSFYEEAAVALSEHVPSARSAESWIFNETEVGRMLLEVVAELRSRDVPPDVIGYMLPTWDR